MNNAISSIDHISEHKYTDIEDEQQTYSLNFFF